MRLLAACFVVILSGCAAPTGEGSSINWTGYATKANKIYDAEGNEGWYIECPKSMSMCLDRAKQVCPTGFVPVTTSSTAADKNLLFNPVLGGYQTLSTGGSHSIIGYCRDQIPPSSEAE